MWVQTAWLVAGFAVLALTSASVGALVAGLLLVGWWGGLNRSYARALVAVGGDQDGPARWRARSRPRYEGDRHVAVQALVIGGVALAASASGALAEIRVSDASAFVVVALANTALAAVVYASSLVDWYYVRPRVDGVVCEPLCRRLRDDVCMRVTRRWYAHRSVAELLAITALVVGLSALCVWLIPGADDQGVDVSVAVIGAVIGLIAVFGGGAFDTLRNRAIDAPHHWVGDDLHRNPGERGYVVHVDVRNLIVRREKNNRWGTKQGLPHRQLGWDFESVEFRDCLASQKGCIAVNPDCERAKSEFEAPKMPRRWVI